MNNVALRRVSVVGLVAGLMLIAVPDRGVGGGTGPFQFHSLTPCRLVDTRLTPGNPFPGNGGPIVGTGTTRTFTAQGNCGVPAGAAAVTINSTAVGPTGAGFFTLFPAGIAVPNVSNLNFNAGEPALGNGAIVPLAATTPDLSLYAKAGPIPGPGTVHVVIDVTGYFQ